MNKNMPEVAPTTELVGVCLTHNLTEAEKSDLLARPVDYIYERTGVTIEPSLNVEILPANADEVHLVLPYYSAIEDFHANHLYDEQLEDISGGEIALSVGIVTALGIVGGGLAGGVIGGLSATTIGIGVTAGFVIGAATGVIAGAIVGAGVGTGIAVGINSLNEEAKKKSDSADSGK